MSALRGPSDGSEEDRLRAPQGDFTVVGFMKEVTSDVHPAVGAGARGRSAAWLCGMRAEGGSWVRPLP